MPTDAEIKAAAEALNKSLSKNPVWACRGLALVALEAAERVRAAAGAGDDCEALEKAADIIEQMAGKTERG